MKWTVKVVAEVVPGALVQIAEIGWESVAPEVLEPVGCEFGVPGGVLDVAVAEVIVVIPLPVERCRFEHRIIP